MHQSSPISTCFNPPFGSAISEMQFKSDTGGGYRYGFNNQEKENELGDYYAFEYRIHDARLGRFLSVDPMSGSLVAFSCYSFARNCPILYIDYLGLDGIIPESVWNNSINNSLLPGLASYAGLVNAVGSDVAGLGSLLNPINWYKSWCFFNSTDGKWEMKRCQVFLEIKNAVDIYVKYETDLVFQIHVNVYIYSTIKDKIKNASTEEVQYYTTHALYNFATMFIGVGEVKGLMKSGKFIEYITKLSAWMYTKETPLARIFAKTSNFVNSIDWHHIIPSTLKNEDVSQAAMRAGYQFEQKMGIDGTTGNKIPLEQFLKKNGKGTHGNAPKYDEQIKSAFKLFEKNFKNYTDVQAKNFIDDLNSQIINAIDANPTVKLNDLHLNLKVKDNY
jgi:RHS repeat-associated protein